MTGLEACLLLRDPAELTAHGMHDQILRVWAGYLREPEGIDSDVFEAVFGSLLTAYNSLIAGKYQDSPRKMPPAVSGEEAEGNWRDFALDGYRAGGFQNEPEGTEAPPWWPEELDLSFPWRRGLLRELAYLAGYQSAATTKAQQAHYHAAHPQVQEETTS